MQGGGSVNPDAKNPSGSGSASVQSEKTRLASRLCLGRQEVHLIEMHFSSSHFLSLSPIPNISFLSSLSHRIGALHFPTGTVFEIPAVTAQHFRGHTSTTPSDPHIYSAISHILRTRPHASCCPDSHHRHSRCRNKSPNPKSQPTTQPTRACTSS